MFVYFKAIPIFELTNFHSLLSHLFQYHKKINLIILSVDYI